MLKYLLSLALVLGLTMGQKQEESVCKMGGYFRVKEDCTRFYRCVDLTGLGFYKAYYFNCPSGTVFDETVNVCNFPWASPPCEEPDTTEVNDSTETADDETTENNDTVIVSPQFMFTCTAPGFFAHESDCQRFWLCNGGGSENNALVPELYKCPDKFLFNDSMRRCVKEEEVECNKEPDLTRIAFEPVPYQLSVDELSGFFARFRNL